MTASRAAWVVAALFLPLPACKLQETPSTSVVGAKNVCVTDADCVDPRNKCLFTSGGASCRAGAVCACFSGGPFTLPDHDLTFAITPAALSGLASGRTYILHGVAPPAVNPGVVPDIVLPGLTAATVTVTPPAMAVGSDGCSWATTGGLIPIRSATFASVDARLGLPAEVIVLPGSSAGAVSTTLTPGLYDLSIELDDDPSCPIPPLFVNGLDPVMQSPSIDLRKVTLSTMQGVLKTPTNADFTDYRVEIVEGATGARISTVGDVMPSANGEAQFGRVVDGVLHPLEYYAPIPAAGAKIRAFWLRFTPKTLPLPSYAFPDDLFVTAADKAKPQLDFTGVTPSPVTVGVRVEDASTSAGIAGRVYVESVPSGLSGVPPEIVSSFSTSAVTSATSVGDLRLMLPPGKYRANGVPSTELLGIAATDWDVPTSPAQQGGRLMSLGAPTSLSVHVTTPGASPAPNVVVELEALQRRSGPFDAVFNAPRLVARSATGITDDNGRVVIAHDAGGYSLRVRFAAETLLPWTTLRFADTSSGAIQLAADLPIELDGRVLVGNGIAGPAEVQGGSLRVYALAPALTADQGGGDEYPAHYVLVGEAELGVDVASGDTSKRGTYRVFLPPQLDGVP